MSQTLRGAYELFRKDVLPGLCSDGYELGSDISVTYVPGKHIEVMMSNVAEVGGLQRQLGSMYEGFSLRVSFSG